LTDNVSRIHKIRMPARLPPLQAIVAFEAAARRQSYSRAAEELSLTHGAISHAIRGLEDRLGTRLFRREGRHMLLTQEGQTLAAQVRQGLRLLEKAFERDPAAGPARLVVSALPAFATRWLVPRLARFHATHPNIAVDLRPAVELARLERDGIHVALRYGPGGWPGLQHERLMEERLFPVCSPTYRERRLPRRPADLADCVLLRHPRQPWAPWFAAAGLDLPEPAASPAYADAAMLLDAAASGQGIALARAALVDGDLRTGRLIRLFDVAISDGYGYWVVWRADTAQQREIEAFREWLMAEVRAHAW
jgi:LysR family transcriptional regulator, glycine cleavage system transcriptional activator